MHIYLPDKHLECWRVRRSRRHNQRYRCPRVSGSRPSSPFPSGCSWSRRRRAWRPGSDPWWVGRGVWECSLLSCLPGRGTRSPCPRGGGWRRSGGFCGKGSALPARYKCLLPVIKKTGDKNTYQINSYVLVNEISCRGLFLKLELCHTIC